MEKIKVLFLITDLNKGGAERFLIDFCSELNKREDIEYKLACLFNNNEYVDFTEELPILQLKYKTFSFRKKKECPAYKKILGEYKPHIVHTHRFLAEFLSAYYLNSAIKYVCHGHDNMEQLVRPSIKTLFNKQLFLNYLERTILIRHKYKRVPTFFLANSKHTQAFYESTLPTKSKHQVYYYPLGFNYSRFYKASTNEIKKGDKIKLINVGSFQEKKNQQFIVAIASELKKKGVDFEISLLGDGLMRTQVEEKVKRYNLSDCVVFHGNVSHVEKHLWESHIYLHTARYEPFGLVFLEAMAAGLPIVSLDGKGNRDIIEEGLNGFMFFEEDPNKFAGAIICLANDRHLYRRMSDYGKNYAKKFDMKVIVENFIRFYRSIL